MGGLQVATTFGELGGVRCYAKWRGKSMRRCGKMREIEGKEKGVLILSVPDEDVVGDRSVCGAPVSN
jgi:hypothetical protein